MKKLAMIGLALLALAGCTPKQKERTPGPLRVWLAAEEDEEMELRLIADDFTRETKIPIELVTMSAEDIQSTMRLRPEDLAGVDVVEVDYFDMPQQAGHMSDVKAATEKVDSGSRFFSVAFDAGIIGGTQKFIPWRLSWPAMVSIHDYIDTESFPKLSSRAENDQVTVLLPALADRDLFALLCAIAWSVQADPADPRNNMIGAMIAISNLAKVTPSDSAATPPGGAAAMAERPGVIFDWPRGILALGSAVPLDMDSSALPCNRGSCVPFFGRYLASPTDAPHPDDAIAFIHFMISTQAQSRLPSATYWLPVRSDGFGDLAGREAPYRGLTLGSTMLRALPQNPKVQNALVAAGRKILFENATAEQGLEEFNSRMK